MLGKPLSIVVFDKFTRISFVCLVSFLSIISFSTSKVYAAPSINGVSGIIQNGQSISISGSGFGTKPKAAPIKFDTFEDGSNGTPLYSRDPSWKVYDCADGGNPSGKCDHNGAIYYNSFAHSGNLSVGRHIVNGENFNTNYFSNSQPSTEMFISYWWRTANADTSDTSIVKMSRINSSVAAGGGGVYNGAGGTTLGGTYNLATNSGPYCAFNNGTALWELFRNGTDGSVAYLSAPPRNTWTRVDMYKKLSTPGSSDGAISVNIMGTSSASNLAAPTRASSKSFLLDTVLLGLEDGSAANHSYDVYIDDMYIDNTQARVEICNSATWSTRTNCEVQPATTWSATSITFTGNQGALPASSTRYLYVVDSTGAVNANGYLITFGGTSGTLALAPPTGLRVN